MDTTQAKPNHQTNGAVPSAYPPAPPRLAHVHVDIELPPGLQLLSEMAKAAAFAGAVWLLGYGVEWITEKLTQEA